MTPSILTSAYHREVACKIYELQCYAYSLGKVSSLVSLTTLFGYTHTELTQYRLLLDELVD